jgi:hypothetical protein
MQTVIGIMLSASHLCIFFLLRNHANFFFSCVILVCMDDEARKTQFFVTSLTFEAQDYFLVLCAPATNLEVVSPGRRSHMSDGLHPMSLVCLLPSCPELRWGSSEYCSRKFTMGVTIMGPYKCLIF